MTRLTPNDRHVVTIWRNYGGIPLDPSTVEAAYRIVCKAIDDVDELHAILAEVGWSDVPRAREALLQIRHAGYANSRVIAGIVRWGLGECVSSGEDATVTGGDPR